MKAGGLIVLLLSLAGCQRPFDFDGLPMNDEIESLIDQLASKNPAPLIENDRIKPKWPKDYNVEHQRSVQDAFFRLEAMGKEAIPYLIRRPDDPRFSYTDSSAVYYNLTVGEACTEIIERNGDVMRGKRPSYFREEAKDLRKWWSKNHRLSLRELQIQTLEWRIEVEQGRSVHGDSPRDLLDKLKSGEKHARQLEAEGERGFTTIDAFLWERFELVEYPVYEMQ